MSRKPSKKDLEWERRVLCSDEACIGTIGPDGNCKECGKPYEGQLPDALKQAVADDQAAMPASVDEHTTPDEADDYVSDEAAEPAESSASDDEWEQRTLCIDESCIGVIGPDGRCKECGKPYKP